MEGGAARKVEAVRVGLRKRLFSTTSQGSEGRKYAMDDAEGGGAGSGCSGGTEASLEMLDHVDAISDLTAAGPTEGLPEGTSVNAVVKMKLNTFLRDGASKAILLHKLGRVVKDGNVLLAEGYAFANFHVLRLLDEDKAVPVIDRSFYYRCLLAVSDSRCRADTLGEDFKSSMEAFDRLRPEATPTAPTSAAAAAETRRTTCFHTNPFQRSKVKVDEYNQLLASLSIQMATMATNHLLVNLNRRLERYLGWKHPSIKRFHRAIVRAVLETPDADVEKIMLASSTYKKAPKKTRVPKRRVCKTPEDLRRMEKQEKVQERWETNAAREATQREAAASVASAIRQLMPLKNRLKFASRAHQSLRLYHWLLKETESAMDAHAAAVLEKEANGEQLKPAQRCFKGRLFNLLPMKGGFTTSSIPVSSMFFLRILQSTKLSKHTGDGRDEDQRAIWNKFFCLKLVETSNRKFAESITTDGYAVSALVSCTLNMDVTRGKNDSSIEEVRAAIQKCKATVRYGGVDPGFTDVVTCSFNDGTCKSYSSSRYYEESRVKYSLRKTAKFNLVNKATTDTLLAAGRSQTASVEKLEKHLRAYLQVVDELLTDRMTQKYRKMRFLRHVSKQKAVEQIVDMLVGKKKKGLTVIGFGNWSGGTQSNVSRKHAGPIQMIKDKIGRRQNAVIIPVDERNTSRLDSNTWQPLVNMKANTTKRMRDGKMVTMQNQKVHKVLHCKPSDAEGVFNSRQTTWNRDVNASRNILMLLRMHIKGYERPEPFCLPARVRKQPTS